MRLGRWAAAVLLGSTAAVAQTGSTPSIIASGQAVNGSAASQAEGGVAGCYAISTSAGEQLDVTVSPNGFDGEVRIARGALCNANAVQTRKAWKGSQATELSLRAAGGRYLILVSRASPGSAGTFELVAHRRSVATEFAAAETPLSNTAAPATAPQPADEEMSARHQLMLAQVEQRRLQLAELEQQRLAQEAEARRQQERDQIAWEQREAEAAAIRANQPDTGALIAGAFLQGFNEVTAQANASAEVAESYNRRIRAMEREYQARQEEERAQAAAATAQTAEQRRVAQENLAAAQQRMAQARQQQAAAQQQPPPGQAGTPGRPQAGGVQSAEAELYYFPESLVYCTDIRPGSVDCRWEGNGEILGFNDTRFASDQDFLNSIRGNCAGIGAGSGTNGQGQAERLYRCNVGWTSFSPFAVQAMRDLRYFNLRRVFRCPSSVRTCNSGG